MPKLGELFTLHRSLALHAVESHVATASQFSMHLDIKNTKGLVFYVEIQGSWHFHFRRLYELASKLNYGNLLTRGGRAKKFGRLSLFLS